MRTFPLSRHQTRRLAGAAVSAALLSLGHAAVSGTPAYAAAGCVTTTGSTTIQVVCSAAGSDQISIPAGVLPTVHVAVTGAGGGGSKSNTFWSAGGKGAVVTGDVTPPANTGYLKVIVGAGGVAGVPSPFNTTGPGGGGDGSGIFAYDAGNTLLADVIVAGGGGGAGGRDINGTVNGGGGNAGAAGADSGYPGYYMAQGGPPGDPSGAGGAAATGSGNLGGASSTAGDSRVPGSGTIAAGGAGRR
ncbi:hypothetical protein [Dactylosporangium sp. NPDC051541]|uniref:glycine-rich domain-containing protein n=1 Tax=Dactylosporangium sp. NPDC051541 TaxID=3363977 RepID=UPI0037B78FC9